MDIKEAQRLGEWYQSFDPRKAMCGYFVGGSFVLDSVRAFLWFERIEQMVDYILKGEPAVYELPVEDRAVFEKSATKLLDEISLTGLNDKVLDELNMLSKKFMTIDWWGSFKDLTDGDSEFAKDLRNDFHEYSTDEESEESITDQELQKFVEYISEYGF